MKHINFYTSYCEQLSDTQKLRKLPAYITSSRNNFLNFSTNDYLGLSNRKELIKSIKKYAHLYGIGSGSSRVLLEKYEIFELLEREIKNSKNTEAALILNSGYQANLSVLAALCDEVVLKNQALVFFDKLNHASLYQGVFLSRAHLVRYHNNNMEYLKKCLEKFKQDSRPKFIVSETVFGMDGTLANIQELINLSREYNAFLYLDEAHATGVFGRNGYGLSTLFNLRGIPHLIMGTFSKALGAFGAYIACSQAVKDYIINKSTGFIYSTALPPIIIGAALEAWKMLPRYEKKRAQLSKNANALRVQLNELGFNTGNSSTHIIPIILGSEEKVLKAKENLFNKGIILSAIRPPTVPPSTSRLRIALNINHSKSDINKLIEALKSI